MPDQKKPSQHLRDLADQIERDVDLDDSERLLIHNAAVAMAQHIQHEKEWRASAHVHDVSHVNPADGLSDEEALALEEPSSLVCHDCGRGLIGDAGTERLLTCPKLHGRRPAELVPSDPDGAVECGQPDL
jgi:hypothetical protein